MSKGGCYEPMVTRSDSPADIARRKRMDAEDMLAVAKRLLAEADALDGRERELEKEYGVRR